MFGHCPPQPVARVEPIQGGWRGGECHAGMFSLGENRPGLMVFAATANFQGADARPCSRLLETARRGRLARLYSPAAIDMASRA